MLILAYIDPGSGSMLLQVILAGVLAVPFVFRRAISGAWQRIRGDRGASAEAAPSSGEDTDSRH